MNFEILFFQLLCHKNCSLELLFSFVISYVAFCLSIIERSSVGLSFFLGFCSLATGIYSFKNFKGSSLEIKVDTLPRLNLLNNIKLPHDMKLLSIHSGGLGVIAYSPNLDRRLFCCKNKHNNSIRIDSNWIKNNHLFIDSRVKRREKIAKNVFPMAEGYLLSLLNNKNLDFYNSSLAELRTDLFVNHDVNNVEIARTDYFEFTLTAKMSTKYRRYTIGESNYSNMFDLIFPYQVEANNDKKLLKIGDPQNFISNVIGVNTLALTTDKKFIIWRQGDRSHSSANLLVPTGSGSLDWLDVVRCSLIKGKSPRLNEIIEYGATRELAEENRIDIKGHRINLDLKNIDFAMNNTWLLGGYRWLDNGGKPDFVAITKLDISSDQIRPDLREVRFAEDGHKERINMLIDDVTLEHGLAGLNEGIQKLEEQKFELSIPLYYTLTRLRSILENTDNYKTEQISEFKIFLGLH